MSWYQKIMDKYGDKIIYWLFIPFCTIAILVVLISGFIAYQYDNNTIANSFSATAIIVGLWQYILSKYEQEKRERKLTTNTLKQEKCRDVISKIDQLHKILFDFDKRLHDISKEHELITAQGNRTAGDLACKVEDLKYDINFLCNHQINMMIPASLELKHPELKEMKKKIIDGLGEVANKLDSYHSTDVENTEEGESSYSYPTIESDLFTKICETNSEFHKKLYTADSYITFPSEDIDNG